METQITDIFNRKLTFDRNDEKLSFAFGVTLPVGSSAERDATHHGTAHFMEHMLFKGYRGTGQLKLTRLMERLGIESNAYTTKNATHYYIRGLSENFRKALLPFLRSIFYPTLSERDIEKEKLIITEEISSYEEDWEETGFEEAEKIAFAGTPYAHPITGDKQSIDKIDRQSLLEFHDSCYKSGSPVFSYSGPSEHEPHLRRTLENLFSDEPVFSPDSKLCGNSRAESLKFSATESERQISGTNSHLIWLIPVGHLGVRQRISLSLLNYMMGEGSSSRLFWDIREKKALSYHNYSTINDYGGFLVFGLYLSFAPTSYNKIAKSLEKQVFEPSPFKRSEIHIAKSQLSTQLVLESEDLMYRMQANAKDIITFGRVIAMEEVLDTVNEIQKSEIDDIASFISREPVCKLLLKGRQ